MRIGEFSDSFIPVFDGVGRVVKAYCETLSRMGHEVYAIVPVDDTGYRGGLGYEIVDYWSAPISRKLPYRVGISGLDPHFDERIKRINLDICHVHSPAFAGWAGLSYAKKHHIPLVGTFHSKFYDDILQTTRSHTIASLGARAVAEFFNACDEVWAVSELSGQTLKDYGYKGQPVVMPNGTEFRALEEGASQEALSQYSIDPGVPVLLFVGQINWKKNLRRIIESCAMLKKEGMAFQLVLAGRGPDEEAVRSLAHQCDLDDCFKMTGHIQSTRLLDGLYSIAELFMFPSIYDNAPMVVREAANMHTPALTVKGSCAAEVIQDQVNGLLAEDDNQSVYEAVKSFLQSSKENRDKIAQKAFETIPVPWKGKLMETVAQRYENLIQHSRRGY